MTISYTYNVGDTVHVKPYSIFTNPTPIEWNEDPYGYGVEWKPNQSFVIQQPLDLFAQYDAIYINYHLTSINNAGQYQSEVVSYANRVGTRLEVAEFPGITGFKGWLDKNGNEVEVGSYVYLTSTVDLFMSCDFTYELKFSGNGAYNTQMDPIYATKHVYVDRQTKLIKNINAEVTLPESEYEIDGLVNRQWNIGGEAYSFGDTYVPTADAIAYAIWISSTKYSLDAERKLINDDYAFQYIMLKVDEFHNPTGLVGRFSKLQFTTLDKSQVLEFPANSEARTFNIGSFGRTDPLNALDGNATTNVIFTAQKLPCAIVYDFKQRILDISKYAIFQIWTASNSSTFPYESFKTFQLYVSNNGQNWFLADSYSGNVNTSNSSIMYESAQLYISGVETQLDFNDQDDEKPDYQLKTYARGNGGYVDIGYKPTLNTKLEFEICTFGQYSGETLIGFDFNVASTTDDRDFRFFATNSQNIYFDISNVRWHIVNANWQANTWYKVECNADYVKVDSTIKGTRESNILRYIADFPIQIFGRQNCPVDFGLKYLKIYESHELKMDIQAAIDSSNRGCLVDVLTGAKYYSANSTDIHCSN